MDLGSHASNIELAEDVKEDGIMTIMDIAGPVIEEEREKAREWLIQGIRNMAETYFQFNQPREAAQKAIVEKYPDAGENLINSVIVAVYGDER